MTWHAYDPCSTSNKVSRHFQTLTSALRQTKEIAATDARIWLERTSARAHLATGWMIRGNNVLVSKQDWYLLILAGKMTLIYKALGQRDSQVDASQRKFSTCVQLAFRLATHLRWLAMTLVELKFVHKSTHVFTVWPPSASRHKLIASQLCEITTFGDLRDLASQLAIRLATHRKSVLYGSSGFANLHRLESPFGQDLI